MLTIEQLKKMPAGTIFATGMLNDPRIVKDITIRWIAVRGGIHDWCIYYHFARKSIEYIRGHGDKMFTEEVIRELVPCDDQAWGMFRF